MPLFLVRDPILFRPILHLDSDRHLMYAILPVHLAGWVRFGGRKGSETRQEVEAPSCKTEVWRLRKSRNRAQRLSTGHRSVQIVVKLSSWGLAADRVIEKRNRI